MSFLDLTHGRYIHKRRIERISGHLAKLIPPHTTVLDVGCGDGWLSRRLMERRPDISISGIDVTARDGALIPVTAFDGSVIPLADQSVDVVVFVDVLHHTEDPEILLREAARVSSHSIVLKDHLLEGFLAGRTLRFMDYVGNARHGVALPYNYWPRQRWLQAFASLNLKIEVMHSRLGLYPFPANLAFGRGLHFVAKLTRQ